MVALSLFNDASPLPEKQRSNEWYTPARYVEAARKVMGSIDLDPASCEMANRTVKAKRYYTKEDNGLAQEWKAKSVWLNPPYSQAVRAKGGLFSSTIENFTQKLLDEYSNGNVKQAILLVVAKVNSRWFTPMWEYLICFPDHIIAFDGEKTNPKNTLKHLWGACFVYLGPNEAKFIETFEQFGRIARSVDTPKPKPTMRTLWEVE